MRVFMLVAFLVFLAGNAQAQASYSGNVIREQGGNKLTVKSGGEIELQSGGTLDMQAGSTETHNNTLTISGAGAALLLNNRQVGRISWVANDTTKTVSGLSMPSAEFAVLTMPTGTTTADRIDVVNSDSFRITLTAAVTTAVSQTYVIIPGDY